MTNLPSEPLPSENKIPRHIAIIMDGNGRWAKKRHLPRVSGHKAGVKALQDIIQHAFNRQVEVLTLFAFSSENWRRPIYEVNFLLDLFLTMLETEVAKLHEKDIQIRVIGDISRFNKKLQMQIMKAQELT